MKSFKKIIAVLMAVGFIGSYALAEPSAEEIQKIKDAAPSEAPATPKKARKILVFNRNQGFNHTARPYGAIAVEEMGKKSGAFEVVHSEDMEMFTPENLKQFDAIFFNNTCGLSFDNNDHRVALMDFVKSGKGVAGNHAAADNFHGFPEGVQMIGGKFRGHPWGSGTTKWGVMLDDPDSPVNAVFEGKDFKVADEIYVYQQFQRDDLRVLVSLDLSDPTTANVNHSEMSVPISWIRDFGKGRVFYSSFGHNHDIFWNPTIMKHYLAGIQFAMGDLEADTTPNYSPAEQFATALKRFANYEYGQPLSSINAIAGFVQANMASAEAKAQMEASMCEFLASDATLAAKHFVCREISRIATAKSVPTLSKLMQNSETMDMAIYAMVRIDGSAADRALRDALKKSKDNKEKIAIINAMGLRGDADSVQGIKPYVRDKDEALAIVAIDALGKIGGDSATVILSKDKSEGFKRDRVLNAYLSCGEKYLEQGKNRDALKIYKKLFSTDYPTFIRVGAIRGIIFADSDNAGDVIGGALEKEEPAVRAEALTMVSGLSGEKEVASVASSLGSLPTASQVQLITALSQCGNLDACRPAVVKAVGSGNNEVSVAALKALALVGDESTVLLLAKSSVGNDEKAKIAKQSLYRMKGDAVDEKIVSSISKADEDVKIELIKAVSKRNSKGAVKTLLATSQDDNEKVRIESFKAMKTVAVKEDIQLLVDRIVELDNPAERSEIGKAIARVAASIPADQKPAEAILKELKGVKDPGVKCSLLEILGKVSDKTSLDVLYAAVDDSDAKVSEAAFRALASWKGPEPMGKMLAVAKETDNETIHILAMRAYARMAQIPANRRSSETAKLIADAIVVAKRADEKKALIVALVKVPCTAAADTAKLYIDDAAVSGEAKSTFDKLNDILNNKKIAVSASRNKDRVGAAVDGNPGSRWDTAGGMSDGDWFMIDLGFEDSIKQVTLDTSGSSGDFPRGCKVYTSYDGGDWGEPALVIEEKDCKAVIDLKFDKPIRTRYIKVVQTGQAGNFWSIHEIRVDYDR